MSIKAANNYSLGALHIAAFPATQQAVVKSIIDTVNGLTPAVKHTPATINATATATPLEVITGYIKSTSAAATTITLPTGTALGTQLGAVRGTTLDLFIDNTAGANTITIAVNTNAIASAWQAQLVAATASVTPAALSPLSVVSGVTGQACFRLMFSSPTAYTFCRIA